MSEENFLSSKPAEFYVRGINDLPDKWQEVIQNNGVYDIDWYFIVELFVLLKRELFMTQRKKNMIIRNHIIIILSRHQHGYPWPSLATPPYRSSLLEGPQSYIPYPHIAAVCRFELVAQILLGHVSGSIGEHHLWSRPCFSSSVLHVWFEII